MLERHAGAIESKTRDRRNLRGAMAKMSKIMRMVKRNKTVKRLNTLAVIPWMITLISMSCKNN